MELLKETHTGNRLLGHLYNVLVTDYPEINPATCALECNLKSVAWWRSESLTPMQDFTDLLRYITRKHSKTIIYKVSQRAQLTDLGMMGYAMMTTTNLYEFVTVASHALDQFGYPVEISIAHVDDDRAAIRFAGKFVEGEYFESFIEFSMSLAWRCIMGMFPSGMVKSPLSVNFGFPELESPVAEAKKFYGKNVFYGRDLSEIIVTRDTLETRLPAASLDDYRECSVQSSHILKNLGKKSTYKYRVEQALIEAPNICKYSFSHTADYLNVTTRQLRSRLEDEGTHFREISLNLRMRLANEYLLSTTLPVQKIAYMLCYTEPNSFIRAYTNYYGVSPSKDRKNAASLWEN